MSTLKHITAILILVGFMFGVYYLMNNVNFFETATVRSEKIEKQAEKLEKEVFAGLARLQTVTLNNTLFEREDYRILEDISVQLSDPEVSREDPFALIEQ